MSRRAWCYILAVIVVGAALAVLACAWPSASASLLTVGGDGPALVAFLLAGATLAQLLKKRFKSRVQSERGATAYSPMLIFLFAGIFLLPSSLYVLLVLVPHLVEWARERLRHSVSLANWYIQPFNISTFLIAGLVTQWTSRQLGLNGPEVSIGGMLNATALALVYLAFNHYLIGQVLVVAREVTWPETGVWRADNLMADLFMLLYGTILFGIWKLNAWLVVPALTPLYLIQRALAVPQLLQQEAALQLAKQDLELRVEERTHELRSAYERLQVVSQQLVRAQEDERTHLARELHDQIGQALTVVKVNLQTLNRLPEAAALGPRLEENIHSVERAMTEVRELSRELRPSVLDDLGLDAALRSYMDRQAETAGFVPEVIICTSDLRAAPDVETACFRVVQEAVTNAMRHAQAKHVRVELQQAGSALDLVVQDDGVGFDRIAIQPLIDQGKRLGLLGMQERVMLVGGQVQIQSAPGQGTQIHVHVPIQPSRNGKTTTLQGAESGVNGHASNPGSTGR
jgi:signal transduction histidine kinase